MSIKEIFKKQGGMKLLKQYWQGGALFTGIGEFLLLGKSRTALEILRLSTTLKTKQKLEKKYSWKLEEFDKNYVEREHNASNKIWICWFQGMIYCFMLFVTQLLFSLETYQCGLTYQSLLVR